MTQKKSVEEAQADASKEVVKRKAIAVLKLGKSAKTGIEIVDMITAYAHDTSAKQKGLLREGRLLYLDKARAGEWTSKEEDSIPPLIETLLAEPGSKVMLKERGKEVKENSLQLTKGEAAYRVLLAEQPAYTEMLRQQGYTEEVVQQMREFAGEKVMNLAYALRAELAKRTPEMKALYEKVYGMPFPEEENYFRAFFDVGQETEQRTLGERAEGKASGGGKILSDTITFTNTKTIDFTIYTRKVSSFFLQYARR